MQTKTDRGEAGAAEAAEAAKFGAFGGVFTPSLLTILGVIMFLRFSTVVGHAGVWAALGILLAAKSLSLITALSVASIATNMKVKGGGAYYLISRSIGVEFGGVIAIFFFIAQAVAVALYVVGFTEALLSAFPTIPWSARTVATAVNLLVFVCVYVGAGWTIRLQYGILAVLCLGIVSFAVGAWLQATPEQLEANLRPSWTEGASLFTMFALFFPAVTGIMAGVNMSGDLKDPARALPKGTLASILVSGVIYAGMLVLLAASSTRAELISDAFVVKDKAWSGALVYAGVFCATLSSALGSMMGAPRVLQAFARDNVFPRLRFLGRGSGTLGEPRNAIVLTFLIAQAGVFAGDLNTIAPIITMFFLLTYATVNMAYFYEKAAHNPSFRPTFRFHHKALALPAALGCAGVMFLIDPLWAALALGLCGGLYWAIARAEILVQWGDVDSGLAYQRARNALLRLQRESYHPKNWRPSILVLSGGAYNRLHLAEYACWFTAGNGMVSIAQLIRGELVDLVERRHEAENLLRRFILDKGIAAFPAVVVEEDIHAALNALLQCHGLGGMRPNTVMMGWSGDASKAEVFSETLRLAKRMQRSIIILAGEQKQEKTAIPDGAINVWWNSEENSGLMLLLAFLLKQNPEWRDRRLRILRTVAPKADVEGLRQAMGAMLIEARITADLVILPTERPLEAVREAMQPSAVLFAGFEPTDEDPGGTLLSSLQSTVDLPGDIILAYNAGEASLQA